MSAWKEMLPATVPDIAELTAFWKKYENESYGCLFSGAGGGYLMVINDKPVKNSFKIKINTQYYCTKNVSSSKLSSIPTTRLWGNSPLTVVAVVLIAWAAWLYLRV